MATKKRKRRGSPARRPLLIAGLAAFVIVDAALVGYAVLGPDFIPDDETPALAVPTAEAPGPEQGATPAPQETGPVDLAVPTSFMSAIDGTTAYRTVAGSCEPTSVPVLEKTVDGGDTWTSATVTTDLRSVFRLQAVDASYAFLAGQGGAACSVGVTATYTSGAGFQAYPDRVASTWYVDPVVNSVVHTPTGDQAAPCPVAVLAASNDSTAAVLCTDRTLHQSADGGITWDGGVVVSGAASLTTTSRGFAVAVLGAENCDGVQVTSLALGSASLQALGCAPASSAGDFLPTDVVLASGSGALWVKAQDTVLVSVDQGQTWS